MKSEQVYKLLQEVAEKLNIAVKEQNLRTAGIPVKSGFCIVRDEKLFIIDKHLSCYRKTRILGTFLSTLPLDDIYIVPKVREILKKFESG